LPDAARDETHAGSPPAWLLIEAVEQEKCMSEMVANSPEYVASLCEMRARLDRLELLHSRLDETGIHFFDHDMGVGLSIADTLHEIAERMAEAEAAGDDTFDDMVGVVFYTMQDMEDVRQGHDLRLYVALPPSDDGHDPGAKLKALAAVVSEKLAVMGIGHERAGSNGIVIPYGNLVRAAA
jgi:hypothetical protein